MLHSNLPNEHRGRCVQGSTDPDNVLRFRRPPKVS